jgi:hypothetical protein
MISKEMSTFTFINAITTAMLLGFLWIFPKSNKPFQYFFWQWL